MLLVYNRHGTDVVAGDGVDDLLEDGTLMGTHDGSGHDVSDRVPASHRLGRRWLRRRRGDTLCIARLWRVVSDVVGHHAQVAIDSRLVAVGGRPAVVDRRAGRLALNSGCVDDVTGAHGVLPSMFRA